MGCMECRSILLKPKLVQGHVLNFWPQKAGYYGSVVLLIRNGVYSSNHSGIRITLSLSMGTLASRRILQAPHVTTWLVNIAAEM